MRLYDLGKKWVGGMDEYQGFIIRAPSPLAARRIAAKKSGDERWLDPKKAVCSVLKEEGKPGIILSDFYGT